MIPRLWSFTMWAEDTPMVKHARQAVRDGFSVVFLRPGRKDPLCPLTSREKKKAGLNHPCGVAHGSTDEKWVVRTCARLELEYGRINLGIAAWASGVVVIDADTSEQVESVAELLRQMGEAEALLGQQPTVRTPGVERDGLWVHEGGTHWYFNRPEGLELPQYPGAVALPGGAMLRWGNSYTVVPPSVRAEGRYVSLTDHIPDVPLGLVHIIQERVMSRTQSAADAMSQYTNEPVVEWSVRTPWHELLEPHGWQFMGKLDHGCGCPVWRRPGEDMTSDRSAIAHENDCPVRQNFEGHGSIHVFSDNVPGPIGERVADGQRDFTKLQFVALVDHAGDESVAQIELGLVPDYAGFFTATEEPRSTTGEREPPGQESVADESHAKPQGEPQQPRSAVLDAIFRDTTLRYWENYGVDLDKVDDVVKLVKIHGSKDLIKLSWADAKVQIDALGTVVRDEATWQAEWLAAVEDVNPTHLFRTDGVALQATGRTSLTVARRGAGKTFLAVHQSIETLDAGQSVAYVDLEDTVGNMRGRFTTMGRNIDQAVKESRFRRFGNKDVPESLASPMMLSRLVNMLEPYDVIIFDVLSRLVLRMGGDLNTCNTEIAALYEGLFDPLGFGAGRLVHILAHPNAAGQKRDADARYIDPAGGATTMNSLSGVAMSLDVVHKFSKKNPNGVLRMWCRKDRNGFGEGDLLGTFRGVVELGPDTDMFSLCTTIEPPPTDEATEEQRDEDLVVKVMLRIRVVFAKRGEGVESLSRRDIQQSLSKLQREAFDQALARLMVSGQLIDAPRDKVTIGPNWVDPPEEES